MNVHGDIVVDGCNEEVIGDEVIGKEGVGEVGVYIRMSFSFANNTFTYLLFHLTSSCPFS